MTDGIQKIVYFVRHGQSEGNRAPVFQPSSSPLTEEGRKQAQLIAQRVAKLDFETLVASPMLRAQQTAELITEATGKAPEYSDLFVERIRPKEVEGKSYDDEAADKLWQAWVHSLFTPGLRLKEGENFDDILLRVDQALDFLKNRPEKALVVVTHGFFLRSLVARVVLREALTPEAFKNFHKAVLMENTGLSVLHYGTGYKDTEAYWRLFTYNDHAHLG